MKLSSAEELVLILREYNNQHDVPVDVKHLLDRYAQSLRKHNFSKVSCNSNLHSYFKSKSKF